MALTRYKLGDLIQPIDVRNNSNLGIEYVRGISTGKEFIDTKANLDGVSLNSYKIVKHDDFAYVSDTSRRGDKIAIAYNNNNQNLLISSIYTVFRVKKENLLIPYYLFIYFNRPEFDRYSRYNSWGSARETFSWDDFCDIDIELPSISIQQKYVDIYNAMLANQKSYERGLDDLKLVCDAYIEKLRKEVPSEAIGSYIQLSELNNNELKYTLDDVKGISIQKKFIETKADMVGVSLKPYKIVNPNDFAYVTVTSRNGEKITLAFNKSSNTYIVSSSYLVFKVFNTNRLNPNYLFAFFSQPEFDRYARYNSWGSARETFDWNEMCNVKIPIPNIEIQQYVVSILEVLNSRKKINEKLKCQIKDICPILIKGSIEEGKKSMEK